MKSCRPKPCCAKSTPSAALRLREATRVLVAKGPVYSRPRVGTVKPRREWHMLDPDVLHWPMQSSPQTSFALLTSVRSIIEPAVAALAAQHATEEEVASIREACERMENAPTSPRHCCNRTCSPRIADATHNDLLANLCNMPRWHRVKTRHPIAAPTCMSWRYPGTRRF